MNRLAIHESAAADLSPTELVDVAAVTGFDSVGLKVAHSPGADRWWTKGAGSAELRSMVEHLLTNRVSVLDVGRIELGGAADQESYRGVLDLASRFGARYVTASGVPSGEQLTSVTEQFGALVADCDDYQLIPLLVPVPGTEVTTTAAALDVVRAVGGGVVLTVSTSRSAFEIETEVLEAGQPPRLPPAARPGPRCGHRGRLRRPAGHRSGPCPDRRRVRSGTTPPMIWRPGRAGGAG